MNKEIERKFLVKGDFKGFAIKSYKIIQAYLSSDPERSVRVRIKGKEAYLTIKGISNKNGTTRLEFEKLITIEEAKQLLEICEKGIINKTRYIIPAGKHFYEVDEFHDENKGLTIAEIELSNENESFDKPYWLAQEVTGDKRYYNVYLINQPYKYWESFNSIS